MHSGLLTTILLLLGLGLILVLVAQRLGVSALVAYLVTGGLAVSFGWAESSDNIKTVGEVGAALLLFSIGLELDLPGMRKRIKQVVTGAVMQIGATVCVGGLLMYTLGETWQASLTIGCCLALSSTLMVLRALDEQNLRNKEVGRTIVGLLLTQDVCLAPMVILLSILVPPEGHAGQPFWVPLLGGVALISFTILLRKVVMAKLFARIVAARVPELEVAFSVSVAIGTAFLTESVGLGAAVGAFCAGLAMGGDEHRHSIETATRPLQGLMAILFFMTIGLQFDLNFVMNNVGLVLGALVVSVIIKAALAGFALRLAGLPPRMAIGAGIMVGQVGEFGFVLAANGPLNSDTFKLVVAVACLSLTITPFLVMAGRPFLPRSRLADHLKRGETIVVAGLGPVGNTVVESLHSEGIPLLLVDRNTKLLAPWQGTEGIRCIEGRIEQMDDWLPELNERPRVVILTFPIPDTSALVAERLRAIDQSMTIIARAPFLAQRETLYRAGVKMVICDEEATAKALQPMLDEILSASDERNETQALKAVAPS